MSINTQETLDDIERDLSASFENFRTTPPETYQAATPAASTLAAQMFMKRMQHYFRHYRSPEEVESAIQEARKDDMEYVIGKDEPIIGNTWENNRTRNNLRRGQRKRMEERLGSLTNSDTSTEQES